MVANAFAARPGYTRITDNASNGTVSEPTSSSSTSDQLDYQSTLLKSINELVTAIRDDVVARRPKGRVNVYTYTLAPGDSKPITIVPAAFSLTVESQGPGSLQYRIPDSGDWVDLQPNKIDTYNADYGVFTSGGVKNPGAIGGGSVTVIVRVLS